MTKEEYIDGIKNAKDRYEYYVNFDNIMAIDDNINLLELANIGKEYLSDSEKVEFLLSRPFSFDKEKPYKDNCFYRELYKSIKRYLKPTFHQLEISQEVTYTQEQEVLSKSENGKRQKIKGSAGSNQISE